MGRWQWQPIRKKRGRPSNAVLAARAAAAAAAAAAQAAEPPGVGVGVATRASTRGAATRPLRGRRQPAPAPSRASAPAPALAPKPPPALAPAPARPQTPLMPPPASPAPRRDPEAYRDSNGVEPFGGPARSLAVSLDTAKFVPPRDAAAVLPGSRLGGVKAPGGMASLADAFASVEFEGADEATVRNSRRVYQVPAPECIDALAKRKRSTLLHV